MVYIRIRDAAGKFWADSLLMHGNSAPIFSNSPATSVRANMEYLFTPLASDPDNDALSFSADSLPMWMSFNSANGLMRGTPTTAQIGRFNGITLRVFDGRRATQTTFDIAVNANPWNLKQSISPNGVIAVGGAELGGNIYFATYEFGATTNHLLRAYNPATDSWTAGVAIPNYPRGLFTVNGELLAIMNDSVRAYDSAANTWVARNSVPSGSFLFALSGGKVYQINSNAVTEYDPSLNVWNTKRVPPFLARSSAPRSVAAVGNLIQVIEERTSNGMPTGIILNYDPVMDSWVDGPGISNPISQQLICTVGGRLYLVGGVASAGASNRVEMFDTAAGSWITKSPMVTGGGIGACGEAGGKMYAVGISVSTTTPTFWGPVVQEYDPSADI